MCAYTFVRIKVQMHQYIWKNFGIRLNLVRIRTKFRINLFRVFFSFCVYNILGLLLLLLLLTGCSLVWVFSRCTRSDALDWNGTSLYRANACVLVTVMNRRSRKKSQSCVRQVNANHISKLGGSSYTG